MKKTLFLFAILTVLTAANVSAASVRLVWASASLYNGESTVLTPSWRNLDVQGLRDGYNKLSDTSENFNRSATLLSTPGKGQCNGLKTMWGKCQVQLKAFQQSYRATGDWGVIGFQYYASSDRNCQAYAKGYDGKWHYTPNLQHQSSPYQGRYNSMPEFDYPARLGTKVVYHAFFGNPQGDQLAIGFDIYPVR